MSWLAPLITGSDRSGDSAEAVLHELSIRSAMARAGFLAVPAQPITPAPSDDRPGADHATELFFQCARDRALLDEWCEAAAASGFVAPGSVLSTLLERASSVFVPSRPLLGERGRWLASVNPRWATRLGSAPDAIEDWGVLTHSQRLALLRNLPPEVSVGLVREALKKEPAKNRADLVEVLGESPEGGDAVLAESLGDRSLLVRRAATVALSRRPASAVRAEVSALVREFVTWQPLSIRLPEGDDARLEKFGVATIKAPSTTEARAERLADLIALVPPSEWGELSEILPEMKTPAGHMALWRGLISALKAFGSDGGWSERAMIALAQWKPRNHLIVPRLDMIVATSFSVPLALRERCAMDSTEHRNAVAFLYSQECFFLDSDRCSLQYSQFRIETLHRLGLADGTELTYPDLGGHMIHPDTSIPHDWPEAWGRMIEHCISIISLRRRIRDAFQWNPHP